MFTHFCSSLYLLSLDSLLLNSRLLRLLSISGTADRYLNWLPNGTGPIDHANLIIHLKNRLAV